MLTRPSAVPSGRLAVPPKFRQHSAPPVPWIDRFEAGAGDSVIKGVRPKMVPTRFSLANVATMLAPTSWPAKSPPGASPGTTGGLGIGSLARPSTQGVIRPDNSFCARPPPFMEWDLWSLLDRWSWSWAWSVGMVVVTPTPSWLGRGSRAGIISWVVTGMF